MKGKITIFRGLSLRHFFVTSTLTVSISPCNGEVARCFTVFYLAPPTSPPRELSRIYLYTLFLIMLITNLCEFLALVKDEK